MHVQASLPSLATETSWLSAELSSDELHIKRMSAQLSHLKTNADEQLLRQGVLTATALVKSAAYSITAGQAA